MLRDKTTVGIAWGFAIGTILISVFQICQHLRNYTEPSFQRFIIRIIFLVPFYAVCSCLALHYRHNSIYYETPRDCYEAWVIYNFMSLCMAYVGGPGAVVVKCEGKFIKPSWVLCTCCMKPIPVDGFFLRRCKQGTLQFVIIKPILAVLTLILFIINKYHVSMWHADDGYPYIAAIYNVCYAVALFWLLLLYVGTEELLKPYKPLLKFACFKAVIFLTFWQTMVISFIATRFNIEAEDAEAMQNWIIVAEMFFAACGMLFAFPWSEYQIGGSAKGMTWDGFLHAVSIMDVLSDIMHMFNPSYGTYVLHTDGGPEANVKKKLFQGGARSATKDSEAYSGMTSNTVKKGRRKATRVNAEETNDDEEGQQWYGGTEKPGFVQRIFGAAQETGHQIISIIPGITEQERDQAQLLASDSDAEYDEENVQDNQIDADMLNTSSDDERHEHTGRITTGAIAKGPQGFARGGTALPDSTSRVEAAFGDAFGAPAPAARQAPVPDSMSRVEMAFADAFGPPPGEPASAFKAAVPLGSPLVPALAPPPSRPTRSVGVPPLPLLAPPPRAGGSASSAGEPSSASQGGAASDPQAKEPSAPPATELRADDGVDSDAAKTAGAGAAAAGTAGEAAAEAAGEAAADAAEPAGKVVTAAAATAGEDAAAAASTAGEAAAAEPTGEAADADADAEPAAEDAAAAAAAEPAGEDAAAAAAATAGESAVADAQPADEDAGQSNEDAAAAVQEAAAVVHEASVAATADEAPAAHGTAAAGESFSAGGTAADAAAEPASEAAEGAQQQDVPTGDAGRV